MNSIAIDRRDARENAGRRSPFAVLLRLCVAGFAVALTLLVGATPAYAHAQLISSTPEDGAELDEAPSEIVLEFSEEVDADSTEIAVTKSGESDPLPGTEMTVEEREITVPADFPEAGDYTVAYRLVSKDGHPVEGSLEFTIANGSEKPDVSVPASPEADRDDAASDAGIGWAPIVAIATVVLVLVIVVVFVMRARKQTE